MKEILFHVNTIENNLKELKLLEFKADVIRGSLKSEVNIVNNFMLDSYHEKIYKKECENEQAIKAIREIIGG